MRAAPTLRSTSTPPSFAMDAIITPPPTMLVGPTTSSTKKEDVVSMQISNDICEEQVQEKATQEMLANIIFNHNVAGPTEARDSNQKCSSSSSSNSSSISNSYCTEPCRSESRSERRRHRAGPPPLQAQVFLPPGLAPPPLPTTTPMEVDLGQESAYKYRLKLEAALSPGMTTIMDSTMTIRSRRKRSSMKKLSVDAIHKKVCICVDEHTFILHPPKQRRRRQANKAVDMSRTLATTKATQTGEASTEKIARRVSVVLTPASATCAFTSGEPYSVWRSPRTPAVPQPPKKRATQGPKPPAPPLLPARPKFVSCAFLPALRVRRASPAPRSPVPASSARPARQPSPMPESQRRAAPTMAPEWVRNKDIARVLCSVAPLIDAPRAGCPIQILRPPLMPAPESPQTSFLAYDEL